jgi:choline dehydrogenase-like flavoprotein
MLGGSSGINGLAWNRASSPEYDSWNTFAPGAGWTFSGLLPHMKNSESVSLIPSNPYPGITSEEAAAAQMNLPRVSGFSGPIVVSRMLKLYNTSAVKVCLL